MIYELRFGFCCNVYPDFTVFQRVLALAGSTALAFDTDILSVLRLRHFVLEYLAFPSSA